jgi:hypothetical protein
MNIDVNWLDFLRAYRRCQALFVNITPFKNSDDDKGRSKWSIIFDLIRHNDNHLESLTVNMIIPMLDTRSCT